MKKIILTLTVWMTSVVFIYAEDITICRRYNYSRRDILAGNRDAFSYNLPDNRR